MKLKILESAKADLQQGFYFYESQSESGKGEFFSPPPTPSSLRVHTGRFPETAEPWPGAAGND